MRHEYFNWQFSSRPRSLLKTPSEMRFFLLFLPVSYFCEIVPARDITLDYGTFGIETVCAVAQKLSPRYPFQHLQLLKKIALVESNFGNLGCAKNIFGGEKHSPFQRAKEIVADFENFENYAESTITTENCRDEIWGAETAIEIVSRNFLPLCSFEEKAPQICLVSIIDGSESISDDEFEQKKIAAYKIAEIAQNIGILNQKVFQFANVPILISGINENSPVFQFKKFKEDFLGQKQIGGGSVIGENIQKISSDYFHNCDKKYLILASDGFESNYTSSNISSISVAAGIEILPLIPSLPAKPIPESISEFSQKFHLVTQSHQQRKFFSQSSCHYFFILEEEHVIVKIKSSVLKVLDFWFSETYLFPSKSLHDELVYSIQEDEIAQMIASIHSVSGLISLAVCTDGTDSYRRKQKSDSYEIEFIIDNQPRQFTHGANQPWKSNSSKKLLRIWLPLFIFIMLLLLVILFLLRKRKFKRAISPASSKTMTICDFSESNFPETNDFEAASTKTYEASIDEKLNQLEQLAKVVFEKGTEEEVREVIRELQFYVGNEVATPNISDLSDAGMRVLQLIDVQKGILSEMESQNYEVLKRIVHYAEFFIKPEKDEFRGSQCLEHLQKAKAILEAEHTLVGKFLKYDSLRCYQINFSEQIGDSTTYEKLTKAILNLHSKSIENPAVCNHPKWVS